MLLHGLAGSGLYWGRDFDSLADRAMLVVPDLLGFGCSPRPDVAYTAQDHVSALGRCLEEVGVDQPVVLVGHSIGGIVAVAFAAAHPRRVAGVVCFGPPLYASESAARRHIAALGALERLFALDTTAARLVCEWMCRHRELAASLVAVARPDLPAALARDGVQHSWPSYVGTLQNLILRHQGFEWLSRLDVPVRFVVGAKDRIPDVSFLSEIAAHHGPVEIELVDDGGHDLPLTHPQVCLAAISAVVPSA